MCVKNKYVMISLSDLIDFPSEGNSQGEILGFQVIFFQQRNFVHWQFCMSVFISGSERVTLNMEMVCLPSAVCSCQKCGWAMQKLCVVWS